jgi:hypothetical protein
MFNIKLYDRTDLKYYRLQSTIRTDPGKVGSGGGFSRASLTPERLQQLQRPLEPRTSLAPMG